MEKILLTQLPELVQRVLMQIQVKPAHATVLALEGDLGAGKTTFVQALAHELGITETVQSPTYVLMKSYPISYKGFSKLIHIDAYRLENPGEFVALRPEEFLHDPKNIVCVEWPEKLGNALPEPDITLKFSSQDVGEGERCITFN